ncbi:MAG: hypothetical protein R2774_01520 [Saprospiraceae bacterium]
MYNPSIGRFLSVDPLTKSYPMLTPYQFASNSPIANSDLDGLEAKLEIYNTDKEGNVWLTVSDKFDLYNRTYKNGQLIGAQKISQQQFNKTLNTMWQTFTEEKTAGYIVQGFDQYRSNSSMSVSGTTRHNDQSQGTLTIASTDDNYVIAVYDPTIVKQRKPVTFKESFDMAMKAKDVFFSNPDPLVEGSAAFKQSFDNFVTAISLPISGQGVLKGGTVATKFLSGAGTVNSLDDLTANMTSNGKSVLQNSYGGDFIKLGISSLNLIKSVKDLKSTSGKLTDVISTLTDLKGTSDSLKAIKDKK